MTVKSRVEEAIADRVEKTTTYEIPLSDEDMDAIATHDALQAPDIVETLSFQLQKLSGVTNAKLGVRGILVTVSAHANSGMWFWIEQTIIAYLRKAICGGTHDEI